MPVNPDLLGDGTTPRRRKIVSEGGGGVAQTGSPSSPLSLAQGRVLVPQRDIATSAPARRRIITNATSEGVLGLTSAPADEVSRPWLDRPSQVEQEQQQRNAINEEQTAFENELAAAERLAQAQAGEIDADLINDDTWEEAAKLIVRLEWLKENGDFTEEELEQFTNQQNQLWNIDKRRMDDEILAASDTATFEKLESSVYREPDRPGGLEALANIFGEVAAATAMPQQLTWSRSKDFVNIVGSAVTGDVDGVIQNAGRAALDSAITGRALVEGSAPYQLYRYGQGEDPGTPLMDALQTTMSRDDRDASGWRSFDELLGVEWQGPAITIPGVGWQTDARHVTNAAAELALDPLNLVGGGAARGASKQALPFLQRGAQRMARRTAGAKHLGNQLNENNWMNALTNVWTKYQAGGVRALSANERQLFEQIVIESVAEQYVKNEVRRTGRRVGAETVKRLKDRLDDVSGRTQKMLDDLVENDPDAVRKLFDDLGDQRGGEVLEQAARRMANFERGPGGIRIAGQSLTGGAPILNLGAKRAARGADDFSFEIFNRIAGREGGEALTDVDALNLDTEIRKLQSAAAKGVDGADEVLESLVKARDEIKSISEWSLGNEARYGWMQRFSPLADAFEGFVRKLSPRRRLRTAGRLKEDSKSAVRMVQGTDDSVYGAIAEATARWHWVGKALQTMTDDKAKTTLAREAFENAASDDEAVRLFDELVAEIMTDPDPVAGVKLNALTDRAPNAGELVRTLRRARDKISEELREWGIDVAGRERVDAIPVAPKPGGSPGVTPAGGARRTTYRYVPRIIDERVADRLQEALSRLKPAQREAVFRQNPELRDLFEKTDRVGDRLARIGNNPRRTFAAGENNPFRLNERMREVLRPLEGVLEEMGYSLDDLSEIYKTDVARNLALHYERMAQNMAALDILEKLVQLPGRGGRGRLVYLDAPRASAKRSGPLTAKRLMQWDGADPSLYVVKKFGNVRVHIDKAVAAELEDTMKLMLNDETRDGFFGVLDELGKMFAATATVNPLKGVGFFSRNALGNVLNNWLGGVRDFRFYTQAFGLQQLDDKVVDLENEGLTWWRAAQRAVKDDPDWTDLVRGRYGPDVDPGDLEYNEFFQKWVRGEVGPPSQQAEDLWTIRRALDTGAVTDRSFTADVIGAREYSGQRPGILGAVNRKLVEDSNTTILGRQINPIAAGRKASTRIENNARLAKFLYELENGATHTEAAQAVFRTLFDYGDLTKFESDFRAVGARFYTFTRKNLILHLMTLLHHPGRVAQVGDIERGLESAIGESVLGGVLGLRPEESRGMGQRDDLSYFGPDVGFIGLDTPAQQALGTLQIGTEPLADLISAVGGFDAHVPVLTTDESASEYVKRLNALFSGPVPAAIEAAYSERAGVDLYGLYPVEDQTGWERFTQYMEIVVPGVSGTERMLERAGINPRDYGEFEGERKADTITEFLLWNLGVKDATWNTSNEIWNDYQTIQAVRSDFYDALNEQGLTADWADLADEGYINPRGLVLAVASGGMSDEELVDLLGGAERAEALTGLSPWGTGGIIESETKRKADAEREARDFREAFEYAHGRAPTEREFALWLVNDPETNYGEFESVGVEPDRPNQLLPGSSIDTDSPPEMVQQRINWYTEELGLEPGFLQRVQPVLNEVDRIVADAQELGWSDDDIAMYFMQEWFSRTDRYQIEAYFPEAPDIPDEPYSSLETDVERSEDLERFVLDKLALERVLGGPISGDRALAWARAMTLNVTDQRLTSGGYLTPSGYARGGVRDSVSVPRRPDTASFDERYLNADLNSQVAEYGVLGQLPDWYLFEPQRDAQEQFEPGSVLGPLPELGIYD